MRKTLPIALALVTAFFGSVPPGAVAQETQGYFDFLDPFDKQPWPWVPESADEPEHEEEGRPLSVELASFYRDFEMDGKVSFYIGYGYESYYPERGLQIFEMLKVLATHYRLPMDGWQLSDDYSFITFRDRERGISYSVTIGDERNAYIAALGTHEVVMYHGHSRYGQGPAFRDFQNYFRMGRNFPTNEIDARNPYFLNEPILKTDKYPLKNVQIGLKSYRYQYRGEKNHKSKLPEDSYTKNIPGMDTDLVKTRFLPGRQLLYFYSCKNRKYWRESLRNLFPDPRGKMVFGTFRDGHGATKPDAVLIMSVIRKVSNSARITKILNATKDCNECFTSY